MRKDDIDVVGVKCIKDDSDAAKCIAWKEHRYIYFLIITQN